MFKAGTTGLVILLLFLLINVAECQMRTRANDSKLLEKFDADKNGWLNADERLLAKMHIEDQRQRRGREVEQAVGSLLMMFRIMKESICLTKMFYERFSSISRTMIGKAILPHSITLILNSPPR